MLTPTEVVRIAESFIDPRSFTRVNGAAKEARNLLRNGKDDAARERALFAIECAVGRDHYVYRNASAGTTPTGA